MEDFQDMNIIYKVFIIAVIAISTPFLIIIGALVYLFSGYPIIFCQKRIGKEGKIFIIYKFRTMFVGAESKQKRYKKLNEAGNPVFKIHNDPRFTSIGRFLGHTGLDELPQLINIIKGDMALFGPRPLPIIEAKNLSKWQKEREKIKPGILSPWVLDGYHNKKFNEWMKSDILYVNNKSFKYDVKLFFRSTLFMLRLLLKEVLQ